MGAAILWESIMGSFPLHGHAISLQYLQKKVGLQPPTYMIAEDRNLIVPDKSLFVFILLSVLIF